MQDDRSNRDVPIDPPNWDPKALVETHYQGVWRYLRALGASADLADDITQETFAAILIATRRKAGKMIPTDQLEVLDQTWTQWVGADTSGESLLDALFDCFKRLTPRAQQSLRMRYAEEASREQIAESLEISSHGVKNLQQRAKAQLRECLEDKLKRR